MIYNIFLDLINIDSFDINIQHIIPLFHKRHFKNVWYMSFTEWLKNGTVRSIKQKSTKINDFVYDGSKSGQCLNY